VAHLQKWAPDVSHWDCICRNCGEEFKRNASKDAYISRWVHKTEPKASLALKCALEDCQSKQGVKLCSMGSSEQLAELLHKMSGQTPTKRHSKPRALRAVEVHPGRKKDVGEAVSCELRLALETRYLSPSRNHHVAKFPQNFN